MGKFDDILLVSDFDRTLTNKEDGIPQANLEAIADFMREGGVFTVATGQSVEAHGKRYNRVPMNAPCIVFNGSVLYDFERKEALDITELPPGAGKLAEVFSGVPRHGADPGCGVYRQPLRDERAEAVGGGVWKNGPEGGASRGKGALAETRRMPVVGAGYGYA